MVKTNLQLIKGLRYFKPQTQGSLTQSEIATITNTLELRRMNEVELQNMRDFLVALFSDQISLSQVKQEPTRAEQYKELLNSLLFVVDLHIRALKERDMTDPELAKECIREAAPIQARSVINLKQSVKKSTNFDR